MATSLMLRGKVAVVFGGGGSIGAAVARQFAAEGAHVFVSGRTARTAERIAKEIAAAGGRAQADTVDALHETAVSDYIGSVVAQTGRVDIEFNATGPRAAEYANGTPAVDLPADLFCVPVTTVLCSQYITARAAARHMLTQRSGVIIFLTGSPARPHLAGTTAIGAAFGAIENLTRTMAIELGPAGVRVVCLRTAANPDSRTIRETGELFAKAANSTADPKQMTDALAQGTMLKRSPTTADTARAAVLLASDSARMMTGAVLNASAGTVWD
jgi:NAD(P)-dependent dehydrogenase (short-subunit alcohol dehydrogenase family)